jgi:6-phosphofructokinase 1
MQLTTETTRTIDRSGGTFLHSSRTNPQKMKTLPDFLKGMVFPTSQSTKGGATTITTDVTSHVIANVERLKLDYLIAIGGDDTLSYAAKLHELGVKVIAVPKTMDNDVRNTEYCIGFSTAITRAMNAIQRQRTTVGSHERIGLFRVFGRNSGYTALYTAYVTAIRCAIPEYKFNLGKLIDLLLRDKRENASNYCLFVMSESSEWEGYRSREYGKADAYGHRKKANVAQDLSDEIEKRTGEETNVSDLTYELRSGEPDVTDRLVSTTFGNIAFDAVLEGKSGLMTAIVDGSYALVEIPDPKLGPRTVDVDTMYDKERMRPNYKNKIGLPIFLTRA